MSRSSPLLPYRVLRRDTVRPMSPGWDVVVEGRVRQTVADGEPLEGWDAKSGFMLVREFEFVRDPARELGLRQATSCCELVGSIATGKGLQQEVIFREPVPPGNGSRVRVELAPRSDGLANDIQITTGVYLTAALRREDALSPWAPGHRLWEESTRVRLEGGAARLPMYEVSFTEAFPGDKVELAEFRVFALEEPELDLEYAVMVFLNAQHQDFIADLLGPGSPAERRLWSGIIRQLLTAALLRETHAEPGAHAEGSLGAAVLRWAGQIWPSLDLGGVRSMALTDYPTFEAQIESWVQSCFPRHASGGGS